MAHGLIPQQPLAAFDSHASAILDLKFLSMALAAH
jgi:hypothetical protein